MSRPRDLEDRLDAALKPKRKRSSSRERWLVEGTWTGYTSAQSRCVHRMVITAQKAEVIKAIGYIRYTDGTGLALYVRPCKPREKVTPINGYTSLIEQCIRAGHGDVARLPR